MCHKIESNFILIHLLKNKHSCTINDLVHLKRIIEKNLPDVFVDVSKHSVLDTVTSFPKIFKWNENKIIKSEDSDTYFTEPIIDYFDYDLEEELKQEIISLL